MLLPAGAPILYASGGPRVLGCVENQRLLARQCSLGPSFSRVRSPGGGDEAAAATSPWNKSLRSRPRLVGVHSGADAGSVGVEFTGAGGLAVVSFLPDLGLSKVGVSFSVLLPSMVWASMKRCRGMVAGLVVVWLLVLSSFLAAAGWRCAQVQGRRSTGCVPGRWSSTVCCLCGSLQSLRAMVLLLAEVSLLFFPSSGGGLAVVGGRRRRWMVAVLSRIDLRDLVVIPSLCKVFSARCGHLSPLYLLSMVLYLYCRVYVLFLV